MTLHELEVTDQQKEAEDSQEKSNGSTGHTTSPCVSRATTSSCNGGRVGNIIVSEFHNASTGLSFVFTVLNLT